MDDINDTARNYFLTKVVNGGVPQRVAGGTLDGLEYFSIELAGTEYWLTAQGLFDPPRCGGAPRGSDANANPTT